MKFGKVPKEDLKMSVYPPDTSAAAVVLGDFGTLEFFFLNGAGYRFKRHKRIKILTRSGFEQGDISIPYYSYQSSEKIKSLKIKVFAPDGSSTTVDKKDIYTEEVNAYWSRKRFTCPNLQVGSVIDYEYSTESNSIFELPEWYFQSDVPVRWSEINLEIPKWYDYVFISQGTTLDIIDRTTGTTNLVAGGKSFTTEVSYIRMVLKNAPALKKEPFITTMDDYYTRVRFQLASIRYPDEPYKDILGTWNQLAKELSESDKFGLQFTKKRFYDKALEAALAAVPKEGSEEEKLEGLYNFLLTNIEPNDIRSIYVKTRLNDCFEKKSARAGEMNLLLIALLREWGLEADPVLISTRPNGKPMPLYPLASQFDHVMALVKVGSDRIIVDATNPHRPPGYAAARCLNGKGWAMMKGNPQWIDIPAPFSKSTYFLQVGLTPNGDMEGTFTMSLDGYAAIGNRDQLAGDPSGQYLQKKLGTTIPDTRLDSLRFENLNDLSKPLKAKAKCLFPSTATIAGDFIYLSPFFLSRFQKNPFKLQDRLYPVDIPYPLKEQIIINLDVPEGYAVEDVPEPVRLSLPERGASFSYQINDKGTSLQLISRLTIRQLVYQPEEYAGLRNFFSLMEQKFGEQIVFKKIKE